MMTEIEIGRLLRADAAGCVVGCWVSQITVPQLGGLVRIPLEAQFDVFGLIYDIRVDDDGLVRQLLSAQQLDGNVIRDNRENRNVPVEISVLFTGYRQNGDIFHLLPPRPPLILDAIFPCTPEETCEFTTAGRFGYLRHILRSTDLPVSELLAAHLQQAGNYQNESGNPDWVKKTIQELIILLRDDYPMLMNLLGALADAGFDIN
jgi:hypothetical protein